MKLKITSFVLVLTGLLSSSAFGIQQYLNLGFNYDGAGGSGFVSYYDTRQSGMGDRLGTCFNCTICHAGATPDATNVNNYAIAWRAAWVTLEPARTAAENPNSNAVKAWQNIEAADSDGDGATNLTEITAGSNPGDATSTPTVPNCTGSGLITGNGNGGPAAYNPNALNASCSKSSVINIKDDSNQAMQSILLFMVPFFTFAYLKKRKHA